MILRPWARHQNGLLTTALSLPKCTSASPPTRRTAQRRNIHGVPRLGRHQDAFTQNGVSGLYSAEGFNEAWTKYMEHLVGKLNDILARGPTDLANSSAKDILLQTARSPSSAHVFNHASMAHNTQFFFEGLSPTPTALPSELEEPISRSFSSLQTLRDTMLATADAMFGPGFVWLVQVDNASTNHPNAGAHQNPVPLTPGQHGNPSSGRPVSTKPLDLRLLTTYIAGTPYPGAHTRQQRKDLNTENLQSATEYYRQNTYQNSVGAFGTYAAQRGLGLVGEDGDVRKYGGAEVVPMLCVNTWQHAWLFDWGISGKRQFLERWWDAIDWDVVLQRSEPKEARRNSNDFLR